MAKLDEIVAVLVEELEGFKKATKDLEKMNDVLNSSQIKMDISKVREGVSTLKHGQRLYFDEQRKEIIYLKKSLNMAKLIPKWALVLYITALVGSIGIAGFALFELRRINELERTAYTNGEEAVLKHMGQFFESYPNAKEQYKQWHREKTEGQKQK